MFVFLNYAHMGTICLIVAVLHLIRSRENKFKKSLKRLKGIELLLFALIWYLMESGFIPSFEAAPVARFQLFMYLVFELAYYTDDILRWASIIWAKRQARWHSNQEQL